VKQIKNIKVDIRAILLNSMPILDTSMTYPKIRSGLIRKLKIYIFEIG